MILCAARLAIVPAGPRWINTVRNRNSLNKAPMSWRLHFRAAAGAYGEREHLCAGLSIHNPRRGELRWGRAYPFGKAPVELDIL